MPLLVLHRVVKAISSAPSGFPRTAWMCSPTDSTTCPVRQNPTAGAAATLEANELSDFSRLWHDGCGETIIEAQDVDRNHSPEV
jgi:hypothetical protein